MSPRFPIIPRRLEHKFDERVRWASRTNIILPQNLHESDKDNPACHKALGDIYSKLAMLFRQLEDSTNELKYLQKDFDLACESYQSSPMSTRNFAAITCRRLVEYYAEHGDLKKARDYFARGKASLQPLLNSPDRKTLIAFKTIVDVQSRVMSETADLEVTNTPGVLHSSVSTKR